MSGAATTIGVPVGITAGFTAELAVDPDAEARFELALTAGGAELGRGPLWVPFLPTRVGQVVCTSEPTVLEVTGSWRPDGYAVYAAGRLVVARPCDGIPPAWCGDLYELSLMLVGR